MGELYKLEEYGGRGLSCTIDGVFLAGARLLHDTALGLSPRPLWELQPLLKTIYGDAIDPERVWRGLQVAADALNDDDLPRAMAAALRLQLPTLSLRQAKDMAQVETALIKYSPDEPRDERGRWTTGSGAATPQNTRSVGSRASSPRYMSQREYLDSLVESRLRPEGVRPISDTPFDGPKSDQVLVDGSTPPSLYGGKLIFVQNEEAESGIGDNGAPPDPQPALIRNPEIETPKVPVGWDTAEQTIGGLTYPASRNPTLQNGTPWPRADHDTIQSLLAPRPGSRPPTITLYVPIDGIGPTLIGSTDRIEYEEPPGYNSVHLIGTPQVTRRQDEETNHAKDSVDEALRMARSDQFSDIYFNRSISRITGRAFESNLRPDVIGVGRPDAEGLVQFSPWESLSPGQSLEARQMQFRGIPNWLEVRGQRYKRLVRFSLEHQRLLGVTEIFES